MKWIDASVLSKALKKSTKKNVALVATAVIAFTGVAHINNAEAFSLRDVLMSAGAAGIAATGPSHQKKWERALRAGGGAIAGAVLADIIEQERNRYPQPQPQYARGYPYYDQRGYYQRQPAYNEDYSWHRTTDLETGPDGRVLKRREHIEEGYSGRRPTPGYRRY